MGCLRGRGAEMRARGRAGDELVARGLRGVNAVEIGGLEEEGGRDTISVLPLAPLAQLAEQLTLNQ